jgi:hypothetical protein
VEGSKCNSCISVTTSSNQRGQHRIVSLKPLHFAAAKIKCETDPFNFWQFIK